jgi:hypothetical protein
MEHFNQTRDSSPEQVVMPMQRRRKIALAVIVVSVLVVALGIELASQFSSNPPLPLNVTTAPQCSTQSNATLPCGFAVPGDVFVVVAANLTASASNNGSGTLSLTLVHSGNYEGTHLGVVIWQPGSNSYISVIGTTAVGQTKTYSASIPSSFGLVAGQKYKLTIDSTTQNQKQLSENGITEELVIVLTAY